MTISTVDRIAGPYLGTGALVSYSFDFKVFKGADVLVVVDKGDGLDTLWVPTSQYTVTLNADQEAAPGGVVTPVSALPAGHSLRITSAVPYTQEVDLQNQGGYYPGVINKGLDRLAAQVQQIARDSDRSIKAPYGYTDPLPTPKQITDLANATLFSSGYAGITKLYDTRAAAAADLASLQDGAVVGVLADETANSGRTLYRVESGALVGPKAFLDSAATTAVTDADNYFTGSTVEAALKEVQVLPRINTEAELAALSSAATPTKVQLGAVTITTSISLPATVSVVVPRLSKLILRNGAVVTFGSQPVVEASAEWIDAGGGYKDNGDGTFSFVATDAGIDGGRAVFPGNISANWYLPGAIQTTGSPDIGDAWNAMWYGYRQQRDMATPSTFRTLQIVGNHTQVCPMDMSDVQITYPLHVLCDTRITYAPTAALKAFPALDLTGTSFVDFDGQWTIIGDSAALPDAALLLARVTGGSSHSRKNNLKAFRFEGTWQKNVVRFASAEVGEFVGSNIFNLSTAARATIAAVKETTYLSAASRYKLIDPSNSYNAGVFGRLRILAGGTDTYTANVPNQAVLLVQGATHFRADELFIAANIPALHIVGRATADPGIYLRGLQHHQRPGLTPSVAQVTAVLESQAGTRIDTGNIEIINSDASPECVRFVGDGQCNNYTIRISDTSITSPVVKCYGAMTIRALNLFCESLGASIDLSSAAFVSGTIYVRDNTIPVLLPSTHNVAIVYTRPAATDARSDFTLREASFVRAVSASLNSQLFNRPGSVIQGSARARKGSVVGFTAEMNAAITAGSVTGFTIQKIDAAGTATTIRNISNPMSSASNPLVYTLSIQKGLTAYAAGDRLRVRISTDASFAGPTECLVNLVVAQEG